MSGKLTKYLFDADYRFLVNNGLGFHRDMPDKEYLERVYKARLGKEANIDEPKTFNEKLQWLKLHDRNPAYHKMVDKAEAKRYVAGKIGAEYVIQTLGVYDRFEEIDFSKLPDRFVLKCTHDSGGIVLCSDKAVFDLIKAKKTINRFLKRDYYSIWREWPYQGLPHRIIAEEYIESKDGLTDYKVHCFNGVPRLVLVCKDRFSAAGLTEDFFTEDWEHLDVRRPHHPNAAQPEQKPAELDDLLRLSRILSDGIPFVRIDFYIVKHRILFSEMTFFPAAGFTAFEPDEWDKIFGDWLTLDVKRN